jgi:sirohydrochlorin cobaltochelatase
MSPDPLVFLVYPDYQQALADLLARVQQQLAPQPVELAQLEGQPLTLAEQIQGRLAAWLGAGRSPNQVVLLSLFMGEGSHVEEDLPAAVKQVQARWPRLPIRLTPPIGQHPALLDLLVARILAPQPSCSATLRQSGERADAWIVLGHGSRLPGGLPPSSKQGSKLCNGACPRSPCMWLLLPSPPP